MKYPQYDTIALVGRAGSSRHLIPEIADDTAVFTIGVCHNLEEIPHIEAMVEIHPLWLLDHPAYNKKMRKWLNEERDFPLYMMEAYPAIPGALRFPIEKVTEEYLSKNIRGDEVNRYYTSSFDYLMGLALLHKPKKVINLGFDMATDTEYYYQREGAAFWLGIAAGLGVEVVVPNECPMLHSRMYAYEGTQGIRYDRLDALFKQSQEWLELSDKEFNKLNDTLPEGAKENPSPEEQKRYKALGRLRDDYFLKSGATQSLEQLRDEFTMGDLISRQEIERHKSGMAATYITWQSKLNFHEGIVKDRHNRMMNNPDVEMLKEELIEGVKFQNKVRDEFFMYQGSVEILKHLIDECDLQHDKDWQLVSRTVEIKVQGEAEEV